MDQWTAWMLIICQPCYAVALPPSEQLPPGQAQAEPDDEVVERYQEANAEPLADRHVTQSEIDDHRAGRVVRRARTQA